MGARTAGVPAIRSHVVGGQRGGAAVPAFRIALWLLEVTRAALTAGVPAFRSHVVSEQRGGAGVPAFRSALWLSEVARPARAAGVPCRLVEAC